MQYFDADGSTLLRDVATVYQQRACSGCWFLTAGFPNSSTTVNGSAAPSYDPQLISETTTQGSQVKETSYLYDVYNNPTNQKDYDWGSGAPGAVLRQTVTAYNTASTFLALNMLNFPTEVQVEDASGTVYSQSTFAYDSTTLTTYSSIIGHDPAYSGTATRGNRTTSSACLNPPSCSTLLTTTYKFDIAGNAVLLQDPMGYQTTLSYADSFSTGSAPGSTYGLLTQLTDAAGMTESWQYDYGTGHVGTATDWNAVVTTYYYNDPLNRLTALNVAKAGSSVNTSVTYTGANQVDIQKDQNVSPHTVTHSEVLYDGLGRESESRTYVPGDYIHVLKSYDPMRRLYQVSNPAYSGDPLIYTTYGYDGLSRTLSVTTPDNAVAGTSYSGNQTTATDQASHARKTTADGLGRLSAVVEDPTGLAYATSYTYDPLSDLKTVTQGVQSRSFGYDALKRLTSTTNPETGTISYTYDNNSNLLTKTDGRGTIQCFGTLSGSNCPTPGGYDALNRPVKKTYSDSTPAVTYTYDSATLGKHRLYSIATSASTTTYSAYDFLGDVTASTQTTGGTAYPFAYTYNLDGLLTSEQYPSGRTVTTAYDTANRELTVSGSYLSAASTYFQNITYKPWGAYAGYTIGNSANLATRSYSYNNRMQPSDQSTKIVLWTALDLGYGFGSNTNNGNLMGLTENVYPLGASGGTPANSFPATYTYDNVNRLSTATESGSGGWYEDFNYDQFGNMWVSSSSSNLSISGSTPTTSSFYNTANNHFTAVNYDNAGNQTSKLYPTTSTFAYDAESRQKSTYSNTNGTATYAYSGDGRRVTKVALGATITYVYDGLGRLAAEYSTAEGVPDCTTCYIVDDHLGNTRLVLDESANVVSRHDYQPYGNEVPVVNGRTSLWGASDAVNQKFTGKERDLETNFDYFGARYYGYVQGRFTSPDWSTKAEPVPYATLDNPQSFNLYVYVGNNPLSRTDPTGHYICNGDQCKQVADALDAIKKAAASDSLTKDQKAALQKVIGFYGDAGKDNKVRIDAASGSSGKNNGGTSTSNGRTTITLDLSHWDAKGAPLNGGSPDTEKAGTVAHEGEHGVQQKAHGMPTSNGQEFTGEQQAFQVQSYVNQGLGATSAYGLWTPTGGFNQQTVDSNATNATQIWCVCDWTPTSGKPPQ